MSNSISRCKELCPLKGVTLSKVLTPSGSCNFRKAGTCNPMSKLSTFTCLNLGESKIDPNSSKLLENSKITSLERFDHIS